MSLEAHILSLIISFFLIVASAGVLFSLAVGNGIW
jgi:hypothetical protein